MRKRVFTGPNSIASYLDPSNHCYTPMVELSAALTPHHNQGVRIYCKMMNSLPLSNIKSVAAYSMIDSAKKEGVGRVVEASSGNTAYSAAMISNSLGIRDFTALVSKEVTPSKLKLLRLVGADVEIVDEPICPEPDNPNGAIAIARNRGKEEGVLNLDQYSNELNPEGHFNVTGPQIVDQLEGKIDIFVSALGTTGTIVGNAKYFRSQNIDVKVVGVARKANNYVPGVRTNNLLKEVEFDWESFTDNVYQIGTRGAFEGSSDLIRAGLPVGPSGGFAYAGVKALIKDLANDKQDMNLNIVFVSPDEPTIYIDDYFKYLSSDHFGKIINEGLLEPAEEKGINGSVLQKSVTASEVYENPEKYDLIDVRTAREYEDHHIKGSVNMPLDKLRTTFNYVPNNKELVFICRSGGRSAEACKIAAAAGVKALNLEGGTTEWSAKGLPRVVPKYC